jgi:hypothetical protein
MTLHRQGPRGIEDRGDRRAGAARLLVAAVFASLAQAAAAAPVDSVDGPATVGRPAVETQADTPLIPGAPGTAGVVDPKVLQGVPGTSRTIDLLLEMQERNPGLAPGERPKVDPDAVKARAAEPRTSQTPSAPPEQPFGDPMRSPYAAAGGATVPARSAASAPAEVEWVGGPGEGGLGAAGGLGTGPGLGSTRTAPPPLPPDAEAPRRQGQAQTHWLIPRAFVEWVREHRDAIIGGCLALLGLLWAGSAYRGRQRRLR